MKKEKEKKMDAKAKNNCVMWLEMKGNNHLPWGGRGFHKSQLKIILKGVEKEKKEEGNKLETEEGWNC